MTSSAPLRRCGAIISTGRNPNANIFVYHLPALPRLQPIGTDSARFPSTLGETLDDPRKIDPTSTDFEPISTSAAGGQILTSDRLQGQNKPWDSKYKMYPWDSKATIGYRAETYAWDSKYPKRNRGIVNSAAVIKLIDRGRERRRRNWLWHCLAYHRHDAGIRGETPSYLLSAYVHDLT